MTDFDPFDELLGDDHRNDDLLDDLVDWLGRFVGVVHDDDLLLLAAWILHTHVSIECYTTPRLLLDSPVPESGKTTTMNHIAKLAFKPVLMSTVSSPALLVRLLEGEPRTLLIDEADRSLRPENPATPDLIAILNSGYKRGATRPVLVPVKGGTWEASEMSTFAPVAMAGNSPSLPDDTRTRVIKVLLMPSTHVEESDWEVLDDPAAQLAGRITAWAEAHRDDVRLADPVLPTAVTNRFKEKWKPLARVAHVIGGNWPEAISRMALMDIEQAKLDKEDGLMTERPHVVLIKNLAEVWPEGEAEVPAQELCDRLAEGFPHMWGHQSRKGTPVTTQGLGRMLAQHYRINSTKLSATRRAYLKNDFVRAWQAFGLLPTGGGHGGCGGYGGSDSPLIEPPSKPPHLPKQTAITAITARTATPNSRICDCGETLAAGHARCDDCRRKMNGGR